jgi:hypothetical protein
MQYQTKGKVFYTPGIAFLKEQRDGNNMIKLFRASQT